MSKKNKMKPSAILTADIHLRTDRPKNRTDDYFLAQEKKISFINDLKTRFNVPIFDAGDLFNKWNSSPYLESWALKNLPDDIYTVPGNHEIESHNIEMLDKSSFYVLQTANKITMATENGIDTTIPPVGLRGTIFGFHWNYNKEYPIPKSGKNIAILHIMVTDEKLKYKNTAIMGHALLRKLKGFDLIVTGHNHKPFVIEHEGRLLVNPGSIMRMSKDQIEHSPRVYLWYAENNTVELVYLPIEENVFDTKKIKEETEKNERLESYVESLQNEYEITLSFRKNMENRLKENKERKSVEQLIWECVP